MPLGLQMTTVGALGGPGMMGDPGAAAVIEDCYWIVHPTSGAGFLTPHLKGDVIAGANDTWQLVTISGDPGHYQPRTIATVSDECNWDVHTISSGNDAIKPLDV